VVLQRRDVGERDRPPPGALGGRDIGGLIVDD
jgi:hypothetical protein